MRIEDNPYRGGPLLHPDAPVPSVNAAAVGALLARCPAHGVTPLLDQPDLAARAGAGAMWIKDERGRMGLGSFKALGAAYVIATDAVAAGGPTETALTGRTYITASAGNHGMSVAAGARIFGARAVIHIADTVPESFAGRLRDKGAEVVRAGADYQASMDLAQAAADKNGWTLLSDSSWPGYTDAPHRLMEGYTQMPAELADQVAEVPTHIFLQAGVGGMACAVAAMAREMWDDAPRIIVVEPEVAPALIESVAAGKLVDTSGPDSNMGRLDCKTPSLIALNGLARDADTFVTISDADAEAAMPMLEAAGCATTPSGGAGVVAALSGRAELRIDGTSRLLCILSEGPE